MRLAEVTSWYLTSRFGIFSSFLTASTILHAEVHRVADGLLVVVVVGERNRRVAVADGDGAALLDLLDGLGIRRRGNERAGHGRDGDLHGAMHVEPSRLKRGPDGFPLRGPLQGARIPRSRIGGQ